MRRCVFKLIDIFETFILFLSDTRYIDASGTQTCYHRAMHRILIHVESNLHFFVESVLCCISLQ